MGKMLWGLFYTEWIEDPLWSQDSRKEKPKSRLTLPKRPRR